MSQTVSFEAFLVEWEAKQAEFLKELSEVRVKDGRAEETEIRALIARALSHFEKYDEEKSRAAHNNVFRLFSPNWCSPLECAFHWITGFRPTAMLRLVAVTLDDLSVGQLITLDKFKSETKREEETLSNEQARIQETIAAPPVADALQGEGVNEGGPRSDMAMKAMADAMEILVGQADNLRGRTAAGIVVILTPKQSILVLEATIRLQRNTRAWGMGK